MARAAHDQSDFDEFSEFDRADQDEDLDYDPEHQADLGFEEIGLPDEADDADVLDQYEPVGADEDDYPYDADR